MVKWHGFACAAAAAIGHSGIDATRKYASQTLSSAELVTLVGILDALFLSSFILAFRLVTDLRFVTPATSGGRTITRGDGARGEAGEVVGEGEQGGGEGKGGKRESVRQQQEATAQQGAAPSSAGGVWRTRSGRRRGGWMGAWLLVLLQQVWGAVVGGKEERDVEAGRRGWVKVLVSRTTRVRLLLGAVLAPLGKRAGVVWQYLHGPLKRLRVVVTAWARAPMRVAARVVRVPWVVVKGALRWVGAQKRHEGPMLMMGCAVLLSFTNGYGPHRPPAPCSLSCSPTIHSAHHSHAFLSSGASISLPPLLLPLAAPSLPAPTLLPLAPAPTASPRRCDKLGVHQSPSVVVFAGLQRLFMAVPPVLYLAATRCATAAPRCATAAPRCATAAPRCATAAPRCATAAPRCATAATKCAKTAAASASCRHHVHFQPHQARLAACIAPHATCPPLFSHLPSSPLLPPSPRPSAFPLLLKHFPLLAGISACEITAIVFYLQSLHWLLVSYSVAAKRSNILISMFVGYFLFKENIWKRLPYVLLMIAGMALIIFAA
ncbi:unnamed protein product [Closterium sp. Naga37s-1]|nr:unnamed protein product [Closterium sp. Naga37s-1]